MTTLELTAANAVLAAEINLLNQQTEASKTQTLIYAARTGAKLCEAKETVGHGNFIDFIAEHCQITRQTAANYMKLSKEYPQLLDSSINVSSNLHLPNVTQAIALMTASDDLKAEVMADIEQGNEVTVSHIKALKQKEKEAAEATEALQKRTAELAEVQNRLAQTERAVDEKCNERDAVEKELNALLAEGGVNDLIDQKTAELRAKITELGEDITFYQQERTTAIQRGVELEMTKKQREIKQLNDTITSQQSTLETINSKIRYQNTSKTVNGNFQSIANNLLGQLLDTEHALKTENLPPDVLFTHQTLRLLNEMTAKCQAVQQQALDLITVKQTQLDNITLDFEPETTPDYHYYITDTTSYTPKVLSKHKTETSLKKLFNKADKSKVDAYRTVTVVAEGDVLPNEKHRQQLLNDEWMG